MRYTPTDKMQWLRWYAWRPIRIDRTFVWLEWVERRETPYYDVPMHEYRYTESEGVSKKRAKLPTLNKEKKQ